MPSTPIDDLQIKIEASAKGAKKTIDDLADKIQVVKDALDGSQFDKLDDLVKGLNGLASSMTAMKSVKASDFTKLANGLKTLADSSSADALRNTASAMNEMAAAAKSLAESGIGNIKVNFKGGDIQGSNVDQSAASGGNAVDGESNAFNGVTEAASAAADAKIKFTDANGKVVDSANQGKDAVDSEGQSFVDVDTSASDAADSMNDVSQAQDRASSASSSLADRLAALRDKWRDLEDSFTKMDIIKGAIYKINSAIINGIQVPINAVKNGIASFKNSVVAAFGNVKNAIASVGTFITTIPARFQSMRASISAAMANIGVAIRDAFQHPVSTVLGALSNIASGFQNFRANVSSAIQGVVGRFANLQAVLNSVKGQGLKGALTLVKGALVSVGTAAKNTAVKIASLAKSGFTKLRAAAKNMPNLFKGIGTGMKSLSAKCGPLQAKLGKVTRLFTFMLLRKAFTMIFTEVGTAFQHLAGQSDQFNAKISSLMAGFKQLGHSVAALAVPLIDIFGPALTYIISLLNKAVSAVNQFLSALTGKSMFTSATKQNYDYAASLDTASSAAKDAANNTLGIDELNVVDQGTDSSGGGGSDTGDLEDCYEEMAINQDILDLVQKIKDLLSTLFAPMKASWDQYGQSVIDAWKYALESVKDAIKVVGESFLEVWTNGTGERFCNNILLLVREIGLWVGDIATAFKNAWVEGDRGTILIQSWFDKWNAILELILTVSESMRTVWNNGFGEDVFANIFEQMTNINNLIANIATNFQTAWQEGDVGTSIIQGLADAFTVVMETVTSITAGLSEWAGGLDFGPMLAGFDSLSQSLAPFTEKIGAGLEAFFKDVLQPIGTWLVEEGIPKVAELVGAVINAVTSIVTFCQPAIEAVWEAIKGILDGLLTALSGVIDFLIGVFTLDWETCWLGIQEIFSGVCTILSSLWTLLKDAVIAVATALGSALSAIWTGISNVAITIFTAIKNFFVTIFTAIKTTVTTIFTTIKTVISTIMTGIKTAINTALTNIKTIWTNTWTFLKTTVVDIFNGIWSAIKGVINSILGGIESMCNGVIDGVNTVIDALNNLHFDIPDWIPGLGGKSFGFNLSKLSSVSLPRLEDGGQVNSGQLFMARENGLTEMVGGFGSQTGVVNNDQIVDSITGGVERAMNNSSQVALLERQNELLKQILAKNSTIEMDSRTVGKLLDARTARNGYVLSTT